MKRALGLLAATGLTAMLLAAPTGASQAMPVPEDDPFYAVPGNIARFANGQVLASRVVDAKSFELPLPTRAWQVKYRTENSKNRPTATVTTVLVPLIPWRGTGPRPLVSYQTAEDGVTGRCAPSYALRAGVHGGFTGSYSETPLIASALLQGWTVSVPDYEGPRSEFLVAGTQAKGVLDGIRAARAFRPAGISAKAPIGVWGYSGGSIAGGAIPMGINGFKRAYPELKLDQYLNASGRAKVRETARDCIFDAAPRYPFLRVEDIEARPNALSEPAVARMLRQNSPTHITGIPKVPIYHYHTVLDEFAPIEPARQTLRKFCARGVVVQSDEKLVGEHLTEIAAGAPGALLYLADRFAGKPPINTCAAIPH